MLCRCRHDVPDELLNRAFDVSVDLTMSSVVYTHTKRFPIEILNFLQEFIEHHDKLGHMRAATAGKEVDITALYAVGNQLYLLLEETSG